MDASWCRACRGVLPVFVALSAVVALGACSNDGKDLRPPPPGATAPLRTTSTLQNATATTPIPGLLSLSSTDFAAAGVLPDVLTCAGDGRSPALAWSALPAGTVEVAVVVTDIDADLFTNWLVAGLDPALTAIGPGALPEGAITSLNGAGTPGYASPCPEAGATHTYEFTLYALTEPSGVTPEMPAGEALAALDSRAGSRAVVTATATG